MRRTGSNLSSWGDLSWAYRNRPISHKHILPLPAANAQSLHRSLAQIASGTQQMGAPSVLQRSVLFIFLSFFQYLFLGENHLHGSEKFILYIVNFTSSIVYICTMVTMQDHVFSPHMNSWKVKIQREISSREILSVLKDKSTRFTQISVTVLFLEIKQMLLYDWATWDAGLLHLGKLS